MFDAVAAAARVLRERRGVSEVERLVGEHRLAASRARRSNRGREKRSARALVLRAIAALGGGATRLVAVAFVLGAVAAGAGEVRAAGRRAHLRAAAGAAAEGGAESGFVDVLAHEKAASWAARSMAIAGCARVCAMLRCRLSAGGARCFSAAPHQYR